MPIAQGAMICAPVRHHRIDIAEGTLTSEIGNEPVSRPSRICTLVKLMVNFLRQVHSPTFGDWEYRTHSIDQIKAAHRDGHVPARKEVAGITATAEIFS